VRNICILAHVDHGKTTLSDCLVGSNGIISERLAGTVRFLDSREDEQKRGITMQSSAISLLFRHERLDKEFLINLIDSPGHVDFSSDVSTAVRLCDGALLVVDVIEGVAIQTHAVLRQAWEERLRPCLVLNKIDRLLTERQLDPIEAYEHLQKIIEQVNAILQGFMSATVYGNAAERDESALALDENVEEGESEYAGLLEYNEAEEQILSFSPVKGNVVFCSAVDSWAFRTSDFVPMISEMLGVPNRKKVLSCLWGNFWYNPKSKKIVSNQQLQASATTGEASRQKPPMFATFVLESIWEVYRTTVIDSKPKRLEKIINRLNLTDKLNRRDVEKGGRTALRAVMHNWLPVARAILSMTVKCVPDPAKAQKRRTGILWPRQRDLVNITHGSEDLRAKLERAKKGIEACNSDGPFIAFVTKVFAVQRKELPVATLQLLVELQRKELSEGEEFVEPNEFFFAFARVFSGTARPGMPLHVMGPKYQPSDPDRHRTFIKNGIIPFLMMNTELVPLEQVPSGNILALAGLEKSVLKTATICEYKECVSLTKMPLQSAPVLKVSLEPANPLEWSQLAEGLRMLNRADPVAEVKILANGEHILGSIGELHLERCIKDLRERFARIELKVSKPIAVFRETIVPAEGSHGKNLKPLHHEARIEIRVEESKLEAEFRAEQEAENETEKPTRSLPINKRVFSSGRIVACTGGNQICVIVRAIPLPEPITRVLEGFREKLALLVEGLADELEDYDIVDESLAGAGPGAHLLHVKRISRRASSVEKEVEEESEKEAHLQALEHEIKEGLRDAFLKTGPGWGEEMFRRIWSLGPRSIGPNVLLNLIPKGAPLSGHRYVALFDDSEDSLHEESSNQVNEEVATGIVSGFQLACRAGPICEEALWGTAIVVEEVLLKEDSAEEAAELKRNHAIQGQVMSSMREGVRRAFTVHYTQHEHKIETGCEVRLVEGVFKCMLQCHVESQMGDQLGKLFGVLRARRAKILSEDVWEGTSIFTVEALIPIVESFNLGDDLRRQTSGAASTPQLLFSHWQVIPDNPFFRATTEDELEEFGEQGYEESYQAHNRAFKFVREIRKRKGLTTSEKVVVAAEKQRTLARKK